MDVLLVAFVSAAFMAVAGIAFAVGQLVTSRNRLQRRLPASGARISEALTGASGDGIGALVAERFTEDRFGIGQRFRQELRLKLVRAGLFWPKRGPILRLRARMRCRCRAVGRAVGLRGAGAKSFDPGVRARRGGVRGRRGARTRRLSLSSPVSADSGVSAEFPGSLGPVDRLRHRGPDRGGVVRESPGSA